MEDATRLSRRALLAAVAALLAACGRKGALEPPPDAIPREQRRKPAE